MYVFQLCGEHISRIVEFDTTVEYSEVNLRVTGELRSVHHDGTEEVELYLTGVGNTSGSQTSYTLHRGAKITVWGLDGERPE